MRGWLPPALSRLGPPKSSGSGPLWAAPPTLTLDSVPVEMPACPAPLTTPTRDRSRPGPAPSSWDRRPVPKGRDRLVSRGSHHPLRSCRLTLHNSDVPLSKLCPQTSSCLPHAPSPPSPRITRHAAAPVPTRDFHAVWSALSSICRACS